jgi:hypothetical protein
MTCANLKPGRGGAAGYLKGRRIKVKLSILYMQNSRKNSLLVDFSLFCRCYYAPYRNTRGFKSDFIVSCVGI